jgi:hypothetical protein
MNWSQASYDIASATCKPKSFKKNTLLKSRWRCSLIVIKFMIFDHGRALQGENLWLLFSI